VLINTEYSRTPVQLPLPSAGTQHSASQPALTAARTRDSRNRGKEREKDREKKRGKGDKQGQAEKNE